MREIQIGKNEENQRLDKFIRKYMPKATLSFVYKMIRKKNIKVNGSKVENDYILKNGDILQLYLKDETIEGFSEKKEIQNIDISFSVIYEDHNILIVDKPYGLLVHEDRKESKDTLNNQVLLYLYEKGDYDPMQEKTFVPAPVNRLDRNTSGIILIGKNYESLQNLNMMIRDRDSIKKHYLALVTGEVTKDHVLKGFLYKDQIRNKAKLVQENEAQGKPIHTIVKPIKSNHRFSLLDVEIVTGRTHQIRLHLSSLGHPIVGDVKYTEEKQKISSSEILCLGRYFLHAYKIEFKKSTGNLQYLEGKTFLSPLPNDLEKAKNRAFR
ncbi:MAG: RluA family pseudouridine synthase [Bacillota bacterium]